MLRADRVELSQDFELCGFRRRCCVNLQCPGCGLELPGSRPGFSAWDTQTRYMKMAASRSTTTLPNAFCEFVRTTHPPDQPVNCIEEPMPRSLKAEAAAPDPS
jgi:hypothetical protein